MSRTPLATLAAALLFAAGTAAAGANDVAGKKLDSGLGELPHYSQWADKSGRDPLGRAPLRLAAKQ